MYYDWIQQHKKTIAICTVLLFTTITVWGVTTYISRIGKIGVTISAVPSDAAIAIDGQKSRGGTQWLTPGSYKISATKDGFEANTKTVVVTNDKKQNVAAFSLTPQSDIAKKWAETNSDRYKDNEAYGAIEARSNGEYFTQQNPVTKLLPYTDPYYQISYTVENEKITITIATPSPRYRYMAVQRFHDLGFNPTDFVIEFRDFKNPLGDSDE